MPAPRKYRRLGQIDEEYPGQAEAMAEMYRSKGLGGLVKIRVRRPPKSVQVLESIRTGKPPRPTIEVLVPEKGKRAKTWFRYLPRVRTPVQVGGKKHTIEWVKL